PGLPSFGEQLTVAYVCEDTSPDAAMEVASLADAVSLRFGVLGDGRGGRQLPSRTPVRHFSQHALPDDTDLALVDVVVLHGVPLSPMSRAVALAASASGCIVVLHGASPSQDGAVEGLEVIASGLGAWLRDFLSGPH